MASDNLFLWNGVGPSEDYVTPRLIMGSTATMQTECQHNFRAARRLSQASVSSTASSVG